MFSYPCMPGGGPQLLEGLVPQNKTSMEQIFTVTRGYYRLCPVRVWASELSTQTEIVDCDIDKMSAMACKLYGGKLACGGTFFGNSFKVNRAIDLTGIAFFGPHKKMASATYQVQIDIFRSNTNGPETLGRIVPTLKIKVVVEDELFWVEVKRPVRIWPNVWHTIEFCLNGPDTARCESTVENAVVGVGVNEEPVEFIFLKGSMQMPQLRFKLPNPKEMEAEGDKGSDIGKQSGSGGCVIA